MVGLSKTATAKEIAIKTGDIVDIYTIRHNKHNLKEIQAQITDLTNQINAIKLLNYPIGATQQEKNMIDRFNKQLIEERNYLTSSKDELQALLDELNAKI